MENSGPQHWQSLWERDHPDIAASSRRLGHSAEEDWVARLTTPCFIPPRRRFWLRIRWDALPSPTG